MGRWLKDLDRILRGDATRISSMSRGSIEISVGGLTVVLIVLGMIYGVCMGCYALSRDGGPSYLQLLSTMVKVPALFILTLAITMPSLYVFNALVGSRLTVDSVLKLLVAAMAVTMAVLASLGTIVGFFSFSTRSYPFMVLVNVVVFAVSGSMGLTFLLQTLHRLSVTPTLPVQVLEPEVAEDNSLEALRTPSALDPMEGQAMSDHVKTVFRCWVILFGLVGAQMGWVLRPFIGAPNMPFVLFRGRDSNFFQGVLHALTSLFS